MQENFRRPPARPATQPRSTASPQEAARRPGARCTPSPTRRWRRGGRVAPALRRPSARGSTDRMARTSGAVAANAVSASSSGSDSMDPVCRRKPLGACRSSTTRGETVDQLRPRASSSRTRSRSCSAGPRRLVIGMMRLPISSVISQASRRPSGVRLTRTALPSSLTGVTAHQTAFGGAVDQPTHR